MNFDGLPDLKNTRHLELAGGIVYLNFGKNAGESLEDVAGSEPEYLNYLLTLAIPEYVREYIQAAIDQAT